MLGEPFAAGRSRPPSLPSHAGPVADRAFVSSLIFDILTRTRAGGLPYLVDGAFWLIGVGLAGALAAAAPGALDFRTIPRGAFAFPTARART